MKKILFSAILLCLCVTEIVAQNDIITPPEVLKDLFSNPQKRKPAIVKDKISSEGVRWVWGDYRYSFVGTSTKEKSVRIMVVGIQQNSTERYRVCFGIHAADTPLKIEADSPVLIKLGDDTVYETKSLFTDEDRIGKTHILTYSTFNTYDIHAYINLTEELIDKLKLGFKKIRFEVNNNIYDVEPRKDNVSQFIIDEYNLIKAAFEKKRTFSDDF